MDILKKVFPLSFKPNDIATLVISVLLYLLASAICGVLCTVIGLIPFVGAIIASALGSIFGIYVLGGIVITFLVFFKVMK